MRDERRSERSENNEAFSIADFELRIADFFLGGGPHFLPHFRFLKMGETQRGSKDAVLIMKFD